MKKQRCFERGASPVGLDVRKLEVQVWVQIEWEHDRETRERRRVS